MSELVKEPTVSVKETEAKARKFKKTHTPLRERLTKTNILKVLGRIFIYLLLIEISFIIIYPLFTKLTASLMSEEDIDVYNFFQASMSTIVISLVVSYFFYSAVFLFTNTVFKSHKVIKTILAIIIVSFVISLLSNVILFAVYANTDTESISTEDFVSAYKTLVVTLNVVYALIAAGFFAGTYLRLKRMKY